MTVYENTMRIRATGVTYTPPEEEDPSQSSLTLDNTVISTNFKQNGQDNITSDGQGSFPTNVSETRAYLTNAVPSQTSSNNWINFCKIWTNKSLTNGGQAKGACVVEDPIHCLETLG